MDDVVRVLVVQVLCNHGLRHVVDVFEVLIVIEGTGYDAHSLEQLLHVEHSLLGEAYATALLV